ncbi:hypothetical protein U0070_004808 [Myodes glareolus]|uniref:AIG1-type G domain-containing protein n=1 Tax=Myodes glareolus TaxID=447135 RepID=A0AAW0J526_MYOGA
MEGLQKSTYGVIVEGPHVLLLVPSWDASPAQDTLAVRRVKEIFGAGVMRHMIVLFTHKEDLADETLDEFVTHTDNHSLHSLVHECGRRYCAFNNRASGEEQQDSWQASWPAMAAGEYQEAYRCYLAKVRQEVERQKGS